MDIVILGSGRGTNAAAILKAQAENRLGGARVRALFSDQPNAGILSLSGAPARYLPATAFKTRLSPEEEAHYVEQVAQCEPQLVVLAGFMRVLKTPFLSAFKNKIINLHPSLLPSFRGLNAIKQAYEYGARYVGCTVHWVDETLDGGRIIDQRAVRVEDGDTLESVEEKVHALEHELLPSVIARLARRYAECGSVYCHD